MAPVEQAATLTITVAFSPRAGEVDERVFRMTDGATVHEAVLAVALCARQPGLDLSAWPTGVWGERCGPERLLRDRDRVELYRALAVDPKEARRLRHRAASQRPGAAQPRRRGRAAAAPTEPNG